MDRDLSTIAAFFSGAIGSLFGIEVGVAGFALAGAFLSVRFCETRTTLGQIYHVLLSAIITCMIVGAGKHFISEVVGLKLAALILAFLILLLAEKIYVGVHDFPISEKLNKMADIAIDFWARLWTK
jgi:hypothetical protein